MKTEKNKKILFINPSFHVEQVPHYGLAILCAILKKNGFDTQVADYHYSDKVPEPAEIIKVFKPDVIAISAYSSEYTRANKIIDSIRRDWGNMPIVLGGPHASCYHDDLAEDTRIDYVVVGEAENIILDLISTAKREPRPAVLRGDKLPDVDRLPYPDYSTFHDVENLEIYPLMSSRGCPYNCIFCAVGVVNSRKWRPREVSSCISELKTVRTLFPKVKDVVVWDDNFTLDVNRGKKLIREYAKTGLPYRIRPANVRADRIDEELLSLLKSVGCDEVQFGVESGDEEVFNNTRKGETLDDIRRAAALVKKNNMKLFVSFIVGLPGDNIQKTLKSVKLAHELNADVCYWNMLVAYKGTSVYHYFKDKGVVLDSDIPLTRVGGDFTDIPNASSRDFTIEERKVAFKVAQILTGAMSTKGNRFFLLKNGIRYHFLDELWRLFLKKNFERYLPKFLARIVGLRRKSGPAYD
ncbi:MAG: B12-binding domain-containing radical SAM protein [Candidatus Omnitrophica bacterium]|nr:B12-binding domain-containing radical SAM protein [Candidatus Omnitrophota bacterium]